jgi:ATP-dependent Clp protease ATP-binding subunit ClpC
MLERFTDRARKVLQVANQEASGLGQEGVSQEAIGTEHLLIALIREGSGVAANVLRKMHFDLTKAVTGIKKKVQPTGYDVGMASRLYTAPPALQRTPSLKRVLDYSVEESKNLNHNYVGTEHLLLGLLREPEGVAAEVLKDCGLKIDNVRYEVLNLLGHGDKHFTGKGKELAEQMLSKITEILKTEEGTAEKLTKIKQVFE